MKSKPPQAPPTRPALRNPRTQEIPRSLIDAGGLPEGFEEATRVEPHRFGRDTHLTLDSADDEASEQDGRVPAARRPDATTPKPGTNDRPSARRATRGPPSFTPGTLPRVPAVERNKTPDKPPTSRIGLQLAQLFARKRKSIGLSLAQVSSLSGIAAMDVERYEREAKVPYEHVVVLARILGIPLVELPGFRSDGETPVQQAIKAVSRALAEPLRVTYATHEGEDRFSGPVDALAEVGEFTLEIGDDSLVDQYPRGAVLGFQRTRTPRVGDLVLALHKASAMIVLRRVRDQFLVGLVSDQPNYHLDRGAWLVLGRLVLATFPGDAATAQPGRPA